MNEASGEAPGVAGMYVRGWNLEEEGNFGQDLVFWIWDSDFIS